MNDFEQVLLRSAMDIIAKDRRLSAEMLRMILIENDAYMGFKADYVDIEAQAGSQAETSHILRGDTVDAIWD